jgi:predicted ATPase
MMKSILCLGKSKHIFRDTTDKEFFRLPEMQDPRKVQSMDILLNMAARAFFVGKQFLNLYCVLEHMPLAMKYGLYGESAYAFSGYALLLTFTLDDPKTGRRINSLALKLGRLTNAKKYEARIRVALDFYT